MPSTEPRGPRQIWRAFQWSMKGLRAAWRHEASFRLEGYLAVIMLPAGLWLGHGAVEKAVLTGSLLLVLSMELLNSAVEAVVDKVSPEFHELAGRGAAADGERRAVLGADPVRAPRRMKPRRRRGRRAGRAAWI